jgi:hypothetical protein
LINAWGFDLIRTEAAKIGIAHIVIEDDYKVGLFRVREKAVIKNKRRL